jgi:hypothetical protein
MQAEDKISRCDEFIFRKSKTNKIQKIFQKLKLSKKIPMLGWLQCATLKNDSLYTL